MKPVWMPRTSKGGQSGRKQLLPGAAVGMREHLDRWPIFLWKKPPSHKPSAPNSFTKQSSKIGGNSRGAQMVAVWCLNTLCVSGVSLYSADHLVCSLGWQYLFRHSPFCLCQAIAHNTFSSCPLKAKTVVFDRDHKNVDFLRSAFPPAFRS